MRYPAYEPQVNAILDVARAARRLGHFFPDASPDNFTQHLQSAASDWWMSLIDIIIDYEEESERQVQPEHSE